mgnify:CR=1 FL=1
MGLSVARLAAQSSPAGDTPSPSSALRTGAGLVEAACQSCHALPAPELLDRETWLKEALPYMGPWLGLSRLNLDRQPDGAILKAARLFPDEPVFSREEWIEVVRFFAERAPAALGSAPARDGSGGVAVGFRPEPIRLGTGPAFVTLVSIDPAQRRIWVGDGQDKTLRAIDDAGRTQVRIPVPSGPVSLSKVEDGVVVTLIGRVFPSDETAGQVWRLAPPAWEPVRLLQGLRRPVHTSVTDLDADGLTDMVVSAYGNRLGNLSSYRVSPGFPPREQVLEEYPGTLRTLPMDWNHDGRLDLLVLRAQAREGLSVLIQDSDGAFTPRLLITQPPTFGYVAMELADLDGDGVDEILLVNGDSGDYRSPHKPFHGVRIYQRATGDRLEERCFVPLHGAYGVRARDFDGAGDLDLALISFFPDFTADPPESFLLLSNEGGWRFRAASLRAVDAFLGRWLVLDAGDVDGDGDEDIVLGSFFRGPATTPIPEHLIRNWETNGVNLLLLRNLRR